MNLVKKSRLAKAAKEGLEKKLSMEKMKSSVETAFQNPSVKTLKPGISSPNYQSQKNFLFPVKQQRNDGNSKQ